MYSRKGHPDNAATSPIIAWQQVTCVWVPFIYSSISPYWDDAASMWTLPRGRQGPVYLTQSIPWLLMTWQCKLPVHQQPWYWLNSPRISVPQHYKGSSILLSLYTAVTENQLAIGIWFSSIFTRFTFSSNEIINKDWNVIEIWNYVC